MKKCFVSIISIALLCVVGSLYVAGKTANEVCVTGLSVEMLSNPVGLSTSNPRLSWKLESNLRDVRQTDYRILVASSMNNLDKGIGDIWDSGIVESDQSLYIPYGGKSLESGARYYWKVRVSTNNGICSWTKPAFWQMALLSSTEWKAQWIGGTFPSDNINIEHTQVLARYLRKEFDLGGKIMKATLYVSGLGLYQAYLNGHMLGSVDGNDVSKGTQYLSPTVADYNKAVYYNTFDVTSFVKKGGNAVGVMLGNGRYVKMRQKNVLHYDMPKLLLQMEVVYADGRKELVCSDQSWQISVNGPVRTNNEWDGETYDATKEQSFYGWTMPGYVKANAKSAQAQWKAADKVTAPTGVLTAQQNPNIKVMDYVHPVNITELPGKDRNGNKTFIVDMGQNMVGWLQFDNSQANLADTVTLRFAETLNPDGSLYMANLRKALVTDKYYSTPSNKNVRWHPVFTYHGFRYVEVKGFKTKPAAEKFLGVVLHDDMPSTATLETSNGVINTVFKNAYWGIRGNYRGMPTDCPQRDERMGWLGDRTTGCYGEAYMFNNHQLYSKWLRDIEEAMNENGSIPNVVPVYWNIRNDNITWPAAFITSADMIYEQYGDYQPIVSHYAAMKKWLAYMKGKYGQDGIITKDQYGDWCMPPESLNLIHSKDPSRITKGPLLSTAFYYYLCGLMSKFATLAGHPEDVQFFANEQEVTKSAFNKAFFNETEGCYDNNTVTANMLPLYFGMVPTGNEQKVFNNIVKKTEVDFGGHVSTGVVGIEELMRGLTKFGNPELAFKIASNDTYPSWGYMAKNGATTIWELWNGNTADPAMNSGNHVMLLGDLLIWDMEYIGGISAAEPGFKTVQLKPYPVKGMTYANASYDSVAGVIESNWKKENGEFKWNIVIPANTSAIVYVPVNGKVSAADKQSVEDAGGKFISDEDGFARFTFSSGNYSIRTNYKE